MKIAISSTGKTLQDEMDPRFGRCSYFLFVTIDNREIKDVKFVENSAKVQTGGAGTSAAEIVGREKVDAVITENLGPRAEEVFKQLKIKTYQGKGQVKKAIEQFIEDNL